MAARWQGTYREEGQVWLEPEVGEKMNTKGVITLQLLEGLIFYNVTVIILPVNYRHMPSWCMVCLE